MQSHTSMETSASLAVECIGGIEETAVDLAPGITVLEGRNATNRTSLLRSIMAALGSDEVALKGDADEGRVELTVGGETYTRTIERNGETTVLGGDPFLDDPTPADLFAFLLESNEARRTVARGNDLHDVIMRPVDTAEIEQQIVDARQQKADIEERLSKLRSRKERLPDLETERSTIRDDISDERMELEDVHNRIASLDSEIEGIQSQQEEFTDHIADLNDARNELSEIERKLESESDQLNALKSDRSELREERSELPTSVGEISDLGHRIGELQERKRTLGSLLDRLQNIIQFNEDIVEETDSELREALVPDESDVTDQLLADQNLVCWTCGSRVDRAEIEGTLNELQELRADKVAERKEISNELDELRERKRRITQYQQRREQIEQRLEYIDDRIDQETQLIEELRDRRDSMRHRVTELEAAVEEAKPDGNNNQLLDLNKRANELTVSIEASETELEAVETKIDEIEDDITEIPHLEDERDAVRERLAELRDRIDRLERDAVEAFNDHMGNLIDRLDYDNLDRIWIERREMTVRDGRRTVPKTEFDLHVIRTTADGTVYEDTIDHLSESEREVIGLVFALAGYLVHDVYEAVPFMLLDSLETIDADRIATLVGYFEEYAEFLVVALLPEDAQAVDEKDHRVTEI